jgi:uncharacterized protein (TIGR00369 family)
LTIAAAPRTIVHVAFTPEDLRALAHGTLLELLGVELLELDADRVTARLPWRPDLTGDGSTMHGGALMSFGDALGAFGAALALPDGCRTATMNSATNFYAGVRGGEVRGEARPLHIGRRSMVWQTTTFNEERMVCQTTQTQIVIGPA